MASAIKGSVTSALDPNYRKEGITYEQLDLSPIGEKKKLAFLLRNVLTRAECEALINISEEYEYKPAMVNISEGVAVLAPGYRDGHRVMIDDSEFVSILLQRITAHLPQTFGAAGWELLEINERLRFLKYGPNDSFKPHTDGTYVRKFNECETLITLQIYLNQGFEGGETTFLEHTSRGGKRVPVTPETGMILVFQHDILHEGSVVKSGNKYTIRTDVLYQAPAQDQQKGQKKWYFFN